MEDYQGTAIVVSHDEELLHAFANKLIVFDGGRSFVFEGNYASFLDKIGWQEKRGENVSKVSVEKSNGGSAKADIPTPKSKESRQARTAYIEERAKIIRPLEKEIQRLEADIQKSEEAAKKIEADLLAASEKADGAQIAKLATALNAEKVKGEELFAQWEETSLRLEEAKEKYPL